MVARNMFRVGGGQVDREFRENPVNFLQADSQLSPAILELGSTDASSTNLASVGINAPSEDSKSIEDKDF